MQDIQLSGGVGVVVEHASQLNRHHGFDCSLVLTREDDRPHWGYRGLQEVPVLGLHEAATQSFDVAVATWWQTTSALYQVPAGRYVYFLQLLEDSTYPNDESAVRLAASLTTALPVRFVTEARWIADTVAALQPGNRALYVRNGIAKDVFRSPERVAVAGGDEPLRIVIEGSRHLPHKGVDDALRAVALMRESRHVTLVTPHAGEPAEGADETVSALSHPQMAQLLGASHVMLKLTRVEGMYGPPLEAFHMGATCVTTPVTGHDEYVRHDHNAVVVGWDDPHGTARALDALARDRARLHRLRHNALVTARAWPSWEQSSRFMALALRTIVAEPPPEPRAAGLRLAADHAGVIAELQRVERALKAHRATLKEVRSQRAFKWSLAARRLYHQARSPLARAVRRRRGG
jgi:glycosyltransferase involved in cell wall biosynthesis